MATLNLKMVTFSIVLLIFLAGAYLFPEKQKSSTQSVTKVIRFSYTLANTSADFIRHADFISYMPLVTRDDQQIKKITSSQNYEIIDEPGSHQSIKFVVENLPPYGSKIIDLTFEMEISVRPEMASINIKTFLKEEKYIEITSNQVQSALSIINVTESTEESIYSWVHNNLKNVGYVAENKGAKFALEHRVGDCTEYMYTFIALARAKGIPARGVAGFVVANSAAVLTSSSYHNWAEFYDGERWILVDPQRGVFDSNYQHYIGFRTFGGKTVESTSTNRFLTTDKRISIHH